MLYLDPCRAFEVGLPPMGLLGVVVRMKSLDYRNGAVSQDSEAGEGH